MKKIIIILSIIFATIFLLNNVASAGRFGGSFGGRSGFSSFGSGGGFSSFSGGGFSGGRSYGGSYRGSSGFYGFPLFFGFGTGGFSTYILIFIIIFVALSVIGKINRINRMRIGDDEYEQIESSKEGLVSVVLIKVAILASAQKVQEKLSKLAESGRAGTKEGDAYLFREACLVVLRNINSITHTFVSVKENLSVRLGREELEKTSSNARLAYDEEGIRADEKGVRRQKRTEEDKKQDQYKVSEYIVVSLIAAFDGYRLQKKDVSNSVELKDMIHQMSSVPPNMLLGMDVVWDPESPDDVLTENDLLASYPDLLPL